MIRLLALVKKQFIFFNALQIFTLLLGCVVAMVLHAASHHPQEFLKDISGHKQEGQKIYQHFCANCHAPNPMIPIGAPIAGDEKAWSWRLKGGFQALFKNTEEGLNAMPPRGGCFECTDKQLLLAILAMLPEKLKKTIEIESQNPTS